MADLSPAFQALMDELMLQDREVTDAQEALRVAQMRWSIAGRRYEAIRDLASEKLGESPYKNLEKRQQFTSRGKYRFMGMGAGDAAVAALKETETPLSLSELMVRLRTGGWDQNPRSLNAALIQTKGIEKVEGDKYRYNDPDDLLPFD